MRLRNVRGAREEMLVNPYVIQEPQQYKGHVAVQIFGNNNPIFIEVGMGKGQFITSLAALHPEIKRHCLLTQSNLHCLFQHL